MGNRGKGKLRIPAPKIAASEGETVRLTPIEREVLGVASAERQSSPPPSVSLKYFDPRFECFSVWPPDKLAAFSAFVGKLAGHTWEKVYQTGGALGHKTGLGYTPHKHRGKLPPIPNAPSEDLTLFELRVTQEARVHGFRMGSIFFLVWLDKDHRVYPM